MCRHCDDVTPQKQRVRKEGVTESIGWWRARPGEFYCVPADAALAEDPSEQVFWRLQEAFTRIHP
jgi:hypothetical protein